MDADFWHNKWANREIGFHQPAPHELLISYWPAIASTANGHVLVPLAGKSLDVLWLLEQGYSVTAVELSPVAVNEFFDEHALIPVRSQLGPFERYQYNRLTYLAGDFFHLSPADLDDIDYVYDRAALIALPPPLRQRYAETINKLLPSGARYLLISLSYAPGTVEGPPFAVDSNEIEHLFGEYFQIEKLTSSPSEVRDHPAKEEVYRLTKIR